MSDQPDFLKWTSFAAALAAWVAAIFAYLTARRSGRALRLAEQQEARRQPLLVLYLHEGHFRRVEEGRMFMFLVSVSNPSDSDNAISRIDLRIEYRTASHYLAAVDVQSCSTHCKTSGLEDKAALGISNRIDAHQTVAGRIFFQLNDALLENCSVDRYVIVVTDTQGRRESVETALVPEFLDEAETHKS